MMVRRKLLASSVAFSLLFWLLEVATIESAGYDERPFGIAMHATALTITLFVLLERKRTRGAAIASLAASLSLWTLKLFTTEVYCSDDPTVGVVLRAIPALHNRELDDNVGPHVYWTSNCNSYAGEDLYRWLVHYGHGWSTALSIMLIALWLWRRPLSMQAT